MTSCTSDGDLRALVKIGEGDERRKTGEYQEDTHSENDRVLPAFPPTSRIPTLLFNHRTLD